MEANQNRAGPSGRYDLPADRPIGRNFGNLFPDRSVFLGKIFRNGTDAKAPCLGPHENHARTQFFPHRFDHVFQSCLLAGVFYQ